MLRLSLLCALVAGCHLYTGGDDSVPPDASCEYEGGGVASIIVHDPSTGICVSEYSSPPCPDDCPCANGAPTPVNSAVDAGVAETPPTADGGVSGGTDIPAQPYAGECYGPCSDLDESDCLANASCHATYIVDGDTDDLTMPSETFAGCWDISPEPVEYPEACADLDPWTCAVSPTCASVFTVDSYGDEQFLTCTTAGSTGSGGDPGQCYATVMCDMAPPACPTGTEPGVVGGCWSGYCIPTADCGPAPCSSLTTQAACTARPDCDAVFVGSDCTCDETGCTCASQVFEECQSGGESTGPLE